MDSNNVKIQFSQEGEIQLYGGEDHENRAMLLLLEQYIENKVNQLKPPIGKCVHEWIPTGRYLTWGGGERVEMDFVCLGCKKFITENFTKLKDKKS